MQVVAIRRQAEWLPAPGADFQLESGDVLLVGGRQDDFTKLQKSVGEAGIKLAGLELTASPPPRIESETIGVIEVVVAPRSRLVGKSIVNLKFREHYGYSVLAIWRGGRPYRTNLREMHLKVGDALLLQGPRERFSVLVEDPDFIALGHSPDPKGSVGKTWAAVGALILMLALSVTEVVPTHIAAFSAAIIAVLSGTISLPQAYQGIDWRILFFVAMLIPLGEAFGRSQALVHSAAQIVDYFAALGPTMLLLGIAVIASALSQAIDSIIVVTILAPILIRVAQTQGLSPYPLLMTASLASSIAFLTPFSHKVHLLVMGPGGYRMRDYFRVGLLVTLATMTVLVFGVRYFWNF